MSYVIDIISKAIEKRKPISFEYLSPTDKIIGVRIGNPHALYNFKKKDDIAPLLHLDLWQTSGVHKGEDLIGWKQYIVKYITNVSILETENEFKSAIGYNPLSDRYRVCVIKL